MAVIAEKKELNSLKETMSNDKNTAPSIGYDRLRISTDGEGVTTLFCFWGCPLKCKYCLNPHSWKIRENVKEFTPRQLVELASIDNLYFLATGGGITFGGGEPLLYPMFIKEFNDLAGQEWNINLETSLNVQMESLRIVAGFVHHYIVDIKDMNNDIYKRYTGKSNEQVLENLKWLVKEVGADKITVRVPHIPDFNTSDDVKHSVELLKKEYGITNIDQFKYHIVKKI